jgi:Tfp pilus assembly protein PilF
MSLLMAALKKAEKARREADALAPATPETLEIMSVPRPAPATPGGHEEAFVVRSPCAARRPSRSAFLWPMAGAGILVLLGGLGHYGGLWQQGASPSPFAAVASPVLSGPVAEESRTPAFLPEPLAHPVSPSPSPDAKPVAAPPVANPRPENLPPAVRFRPRSAPAQAQAVLERAYDALQSGHGEEARRAYEEALRADGKNTDALLGLATLAAREGRDEEAHGYYLRALEADPKDATALAGVLGMDRPGYGEVTESRLKTLLSEQPDAPSLHFALGNLYARQQRWSEAQHAYFQAYAKDPDSPDLIFNLAVSLDHLRKDALAARYYRMALKATQSRVADFDPGLVKARLLELRAPDIEP